MNQENTLANPVVSMSPEMVTTYVEPAPEPVYEAEQSAYQPAEATEAIAEAPSQLTERVKYMAIGAATLTFLVSPFAIYGGQQYRQLVAENAQIPKHRIVNPE